MITQIEYTNVRNIKHLVLNFKNKCSILSGANGIGKSNALNGASYGITNVLLTDKWGTGENNLRSLFPKDYVDGQDPTVTITLDTGITFTKKFVKGNNKTANSTEYYVNGVKKKKEADFNEEFYKAFHFEKKLKNAKDINELRLFTDPLYALQKVEPKALRSLLVELGASVTNEEVYKIHPELEPLKQYEAKFMGDYSEMRVAWKRDRTELNKQLNAIPELMTHYAGEEFNPEIREALEIKKLETLSKINSLKNNTQDVVVEYKNTITDLRHQKELTVATESSKIMAELAKLEEQKKQAINNANNAQNEELKAINSQIQLKGQELESLNLSKKTYADIRAKKRAEASGYIDEKQELYNQYEELKEELEQVTARQFVDYTQCPKCGHRFIADEASVTLFNKQKQDDIANIQDKFSKIDIRLKEIEKDFDVAVELGRRAKENEEATDTKINDLKDEIEALNLQKSGVTNKPVDMSKVTEIEAQIKAIQSTKIDTSKYDSEIESLTNKINGLSNTNSVETEEEIKKLSSILEDTEAKIKEQYELEAKQKGRIETEAKADEIAKKLNDTDSNLGLVNSFIQTKISLINAKAKELTGLDFVMLEENTTNDNLTEVCYPTVNGVEFSSVNTSEKLKVGIQFIHKIKEILGANDLPILADRLEGFDDLDKIRNLTTEQMICTVVGDKEQKEIVVI